MHFKSVAVDRAASPTMRNDFGSISRTMRRGAQLPGFTAHIMTRLALAGPRAVAVEQRYAAVQPSGDGAAEIGAFVGDNIAQPGVDRAVQDERFDLVGDVHADERVHTAVEAVEHKRERNNDDKVKREDERCHIDVRVLAPEHARRDVRAAGRCAGRIAETIARTRKRVRHRPPRASALP